MNKYAIHITEEVLSIAYVKADSVEEAQKIFFDTIEDANIAEVMRENYSVEFELLSSKLKR